MLPKIKHVEFRNVHIDEDVHTDNDIFLHSGGVETVEPAHDISMEDFEKMMLHDPEIAVFGTGFKRKVKISHSVVAAAKKHGVEIHALPTPAAAKKFQELARSGRKVVAKLHITC